MGLLLKKTKKLIGEEVKTKKEQIQEVQAFLEELEVEYDNVNKKELLDFYYDHLNPFNELNEWLEFNNAKYGKIANLLIDQNLTTQEELVKEVKRYSSVAEGVAEYRESLLKKGVARKDNITMKDLKNALREWNIEKFIDLLEIMFVDSISAKDVLPVIKDTNSLEKIFELHIKNPFLLFKEVIFLANLNLESKIIYPTWIKETQNEDTIHIKCVEKEAEADRLMKIDEVIGFSYWEDDNTILKLVEGLGYCFERLWNFNKADMFGNVDNIYDWVVI